ncbi:glycosyl transferase family 2, partial [Bacteroides stercoris]|nr:glycosyl transferase family 2 [Bacteroides stercoris]
RLAFHAAWMATLATAILHFHWLAAGIAFLVCILRFILQAIIVNKTAKDLNDRRRYYWSLPVFDVLQPLQSLRWKLYCLFRKKSEFLRK